MKSRIGYLLLSVVTAVTTLFCLLSLPALGWGSPTALADADDYGAKVAPELAQQLAQSSNPDAPLRFIAYLEATADLSATALPIARIERRAEVVNRLRSTAETSQQSLRRLLDKLQSEGRVRDYQSLWIINAIAITGDAAALESVAQQPNVRLIAADQQRRLFDQQPTFLSQTVSTTAAFDGGFNQGWTGNGIDGREEVWGIERVRARQAWHGLGVDGTGITVAIVDTGVDWQHPDLLPNYRGNRGETINHSGNWFNASLPTSTIPLDLNGHGTHVAGTAVGQNGIGVAPGAQWIAVAIADANGFIYDSAVHAAFQWLLAPAGDPALAPDVVNNSWGLDGQSLVFYPDVQVLQAAGIISVFATGNNGPLPSSINAPASYTGTLAVGASDDVNAITWFSSRGPSLVTAEQKPLLVAPGARVLSAYPNTAYQLFNGTSMATPHVAGTLALMLSANPALSQEQAADILATTAVPLTASPPDAAAGWGLLDSYAAVAEAQNRLPPSAASPGVLQGTVRAAGRPLAAVPVTITTAAGEAVAFTTDEQGQYSAWLKPGSYTVESAPFGYKPQQITDVIVRSGETTTRPMALERLPGGRIQGVVREASGGRPLAATIMVENRPITVQTGSDGRFELDLPAGSYILTIREKGYRLSRMPVTLAAGDEVELNVALENGPAVLLVDSGQWYYDSYIPYYEAALTANRLNYDIHRIRNPLSDTPSGEEMAAYDVVVWSAPIDSPGYIGANNVITDYLGTGGRLLLSGHDIGSFDGSAIGLEWWWHYDLQGRYLGEGSVDESDLPIRGVGELFEGFSLSLNGPDSADNQLTPDKSEPRPGSLTQPIFAYPDGTAAGLLASHCFPYRLAYLGFGLEGVSGADARANLMQRLMGALFAPRIGSGIQWSPTKIDDFALRGDSLVYTLTVRNLSETITDTLHISTRGGEWASSLLTPTLTLGPCQSAQTVLRLEVPDDAAADALHHLQVTADSARTGTRAILEVEHKTPGRILLVDDDRFFNEEAAYTAALDALDLRYDVWETGWGNIARGSPPAAFLQAYDLVLWYTGYDWFQPITAAENEALLRYLDGGGRLFLSSQDFLFYHFDETPLAREYLGVLSYTESLTSTRLYANPQLALPRRLNGPVSLQYGGYQNFSDGLVPTQGTMPFLWGDQGTAVGLVNQDAEAGWRTVFWSVPLEKMGEAEQQAAMNGVVGWLSDVGDSTWAADRRMAQPGETITYTLTLRAMESAAPVPVVITNTLPEGVTIRPDSIRGGAKYHERSRQLRWEGTLAPGAERQISYQVRVGRNAADGTRLDNSVTIWEGKHGWTFEKATAVWVNTPDLSRSALLAVSSNQPASDEQPVPWRFVTYTLRVENSGVTAAAPASATLHLPQRLHPLTDTLQADTGDVTLQEHQVDWQGNLAPGETISVSLTLTQTLRYGVWLPATAVLADGVTDVIVRDGLYYPATYRFYFPVFTR